MVSFRILLLVLLTLGCREMAGHDLSRETSTIICSAAGITLGFGIWLKAAAIRSIGRYQHLLSPHSTSTPWPTSTPTSTSTPTPTPTPLAAIDACTTHFQFCRRTVEIAWLVLLPATMLATGWGQWLNAAELSGWPSAVCLFGWFAPSILLIVLIEMTAAQLDEIASPGKPHPEDPSWLFHWSLRLRLGDMASLNLCLTPVLAIHFAATLFGEGTPAATDPRLAAGFAGLIGLGLLLLLPLWLGFWMGAKQMPPAPLGNRIERLRGSLQVWGLPAMLIPSQDRWVGAAIVGWIPGFRRLWIGDGLLRQLTEQQLDMVILHELAHVSRWHFLWRVSPALLAALAAALIWSVWPVETITLVTREMAAAGVAGSLLLMCLGPVARRCELDADRQAVLLATQHCEWVDGRVGLAASEMGAALISLLQPTPAAAQATWLHPSLAQRLRNLQGELR